MQDYVVEFELDDFEELDRFALTAVQEYNLGPGGGWFNYFRGGLYGVVQRIFRTFIGGSSVGPQAAAS